jgi:uncharacterized protein (TIGR02453 family)
MAKLSNPFHEDMLPPFEGFPKDALKFLKELKKNNNREWFTANKERYDGALREPMEALLGSLQEKLRASDPDITIEPRRAIYRIYRDVRFSKDKTPYKTHIAAAFSYRGLDKNNEPGFYFHISGEEVGIGGGLYMPSSDQVKNMRKALGQNAAEFKKILAAKKFIALFGGLEGEKLMRVPQGYAPDHPDGELLKLKQYLCWKVLPSKTIFEDDFLSILTDHFIAMAPLVRYLMAHTK